MSDQDPQRERERERERESHNRSKLTLFTKYVPDEPAFPVTGGKSRFSEQMFSFDAIVQPEASTIILGDQCNLNTYVQEKQKEIF